MIPSRASSPASWTEWRGQLLRELYERTAELLEAGSDDKQAAIELIDRRVARRREASTAELAALAARASKPSTSSTFAVSILEPDLTGK